MFTVSLDLTQPCRSTVGSQSMHASLQLLEPIEIGSEYGDYSDYGYGENEGENETETETETVTVATCALASQLEKEGRMGRCTPEMLPATGI